MFIQINDNTLINLNRITLIKQHGNIIKFWYDLTTCNAELYKTEEEANAMMEHLTDSLCEV